MVLVRQVFVKFSLLNIKVMATNDMTLRFGIYTIAKETKR